MSQSLYSHIQTLTGVADRLRQMIAGRVILPAAIQMAASIKQRTASRVQQTKQTYAIPAQQFTTAKQARGKKQPVNLFHTQPAKQEVTGSAKEIAVEHKPAQNMVVIIGDNTAHAPVAGEIQAYKAEVIQQAGGLSIKLLKDTL